MTAFCSACAQTEPLSAKDRLATVAADRGNRAAEKSLPDYPPDCRVKARGRVVTGDGHGVAALKVDHALFQQHERTDRCATWYDQLQAGWNAAGPQ